MGCNHTLLVFKVNLRVDGTSRERDGYRSNCRKPTRKCSDDTAFEGELRVNVQAIKVAGERHHNRRHGADDGRRR